MNLTVLLHSVNFLRKEERHLRVKPYSPPSKEEKKPHAMVLSFYDTRAHHTTDSTELIENAVFPHQLWFVFIFLFLTWFLAFRWKWWTISLYCIAYIGKHLSFFIVCHSLLLMRVSAPPYQKIQRKVFYLVVLSLRSTEYSLTLTSFFWKVYLAATGRIMTFLLLL